MLKKFIIGAAMVCATAPVALSSASAEELGVSASIDYVTQYVFRGVGLAEDAVQPGLELSYGGLYGGVWYSSPLDKGYGEETDFYAGYGFGLTESVSADVGVTYYTYPGDGDTTEVYGGLSFDAPLAPSIYAYWDLDLEAFTLEGSIGHSYPLAEYTSLDLGLTGGLVTSDDGGEYQYGAVSVALSQTFSDNVSGYIGANLGLSSDDTFIDGDNFNQSATWAGFGLSYSR